MRSPYVKKLVRSISVTREAETLAIIITMLNPLGDYMVKRILRAACKWFNVVDL